MRAKSRFGCIQLFKAPVAWPWAPLSMGFPRQACWSGFPRPSPGIFPVGIASQASARSGSVTSSTTWAPCPAARCCRAPSIWLAHGVPMLYTVQAACYTLYCTMLCYVIITPTLLCITPRILYFWRRMLFITYMYVYITTTRTYTQYIYPCACYL